MPRYSGVDALLAVDDLGDGEIRRDAHQRVSIVARYVLDVGQEGEHLKRGGAHGNVEIFVEPVNDPLRRRFQQRRSEAEILTHRDLKENVQRRLDRGSADLAVALRYVRVANGEESAVDGD